MNGDIKQTFILNALTEYTQRVERAMERAMVRTKSEKTGEGKSSISGSQSAFGDGGTSQIKFKDYLRFVDMGVGRGHPLGGMAALHQNVILATDGKKTTAKNPRKRKKIYGSPAYGQLHFLIDDLLFGYSESTIQTIKNNMQNNP